MEGLRGAAVRTNPRETTGEMSSSSSSSGSGGVLPTSTNLYAAAKLIAPDCGDANAAFVRCKQADANPQACVEAGDKVRSCVDGVLATASGKCGPTFEAYRSCLDNNGLRYEKCRDEERALKVCYYRATRMDGGAAEAAAAAAAAPAPHHS